MPTPSGRLVAGDLELTRLLPVPVAQVWAAFTESGRLERWIGRYLGDPRSGSVRFVMTAEGEGDDDGGSETRIERCDPLRLLPVTQRSGPVLSGVWSPTRGCCAWLGCSRTRRRSRLT